MAKIYLIRHCESESNAYKWSMARIDAMITKAGYLQCEYLRRRFENVHIDAVYSSNTYRTIMTVKPIADQHHLPVHTRLLLGEMTTGVLEDHSWGNIKLEYPEYYHQWKTKPWDIDMILGATSFKQVADRLVIGIQRIAKEVGNGTALISTHSATIRAAVCQIQGMPMSGLSKIENPDNTAVDLLEVDPDGNITICYLNDASHLPPELSERRLKAPGWGLEMASYAIRWPDQRQTLLDLAQMRYLEMGRTDECFDRESYAGQAERLLAEHPEYIAFLYYEGTVTGYVRMGTEAGLPDDCGLIAELYIVPEYKGKDYACQLLGYVSHVLRYTGYTRLALSKDGSPDEKEISNRFMFEKLRGFPEYIVMDLFREPYSTHALT